MALFLWERLRLRLRGWRHVERHERDVPAAQLARLDATWPVCVALSLIDTIRGIGLQTRHLRVALDVGEPVRLARAVAVECGYQSTVGPAARLAARGRLDAAEDLLHRHPSSPTSALINLSRAVIDYQDGDYARVLAMADAAIQTLQGHGRGVAWELDGAHGYRSVALFHLGRLREFVEHYHECVRDARARGDRYLETAQVLESCIPVPLVTDDVAQARRAVEATYNAWLPGTFTLPHFYGFHAKAQLALYEGDAATAHALAKAHWQPARNAQLLRVQRLRIEARELLARCALAAWDTLTERERREIPKHVEAIERERLPWSNASALLLRGQWHARLGEREEAGLALDQAARTFEKNGQRLHATLALLRSGETKGDAPGLASRDEALTSIGAMGVANPERFAAMLTPVPGLRSS